MIKKQIDLRAICDEARKSFSAGEPALGIYCASRLLMDSSAAALLVALGKRKAFSSELLLNSDYRDSENRLRDAVVDFMRRSSSQQVIIAVKRTDENDPYRFRYRAAFAIVMKELLKGDDIDLLGFYLTSNDSTDYEDLMSY